MKRGGLDGVSPPANIISLRRKLKLKFSLEGHRIEKFENKTVKIPPKTSAVFVEFYFSHLPSAIASVSLILISERINQVSFIVSSP